MEGVIAFWAGDDLDRHFSSHLILYHIYLGHTENKVYNIKTIYVHLIIFAVAAYFGKDNSVLKAP